MESHSLCYENVIMEQYWKGKKLKTKKASRMLLPGDCGIRRQGKVKHFEGKTTQLGKGHGRLKNDNGFEMATWNEKVILHRRN